VPPAALVAQFGRWPLDCAFDRARALGLQADAGIDALIGEFLRRRDARQSSASIGR